MAEKRGREPFVDEDAPVLGIVGEFDDVESSILTFNEMSLRAASHFADQGAGANGHKGDRMSQSGEKRSQEKERKSRMADTNENGEKQVGAGPDEIALELMKFIAVTTGYGRGPTGAGFGNKGARSNEEYADSLLELFDRCRSVVRKGPK